jgi:hypothetical protein
MATAFSMALRKSLLTSIVNFIFYSLPTLLNLFSPEISDISPKKPP